MVTNATRKTRTTAKTDRGAGTAESAVTSPVRVTEKQFQRQVEHYLRLCNWLVFHTRYSIGSAPGFPDICACRAGRLAMIELKTIDGKISAAQAEWGELLAGVGGTVEYHLLRPDDAGWQFIEQTFR